MNKRIKLALFVVPITVIAVGGAVYAMPDKKQPAQLSTQPTSTVQTETTSATDTQPVATEAQTTASPATVQTTPTPAPQPDYGEDPTNPGVYKVFNKTAVMDAAGIAQGDRPTVDIMIGGWAYQMPNSDIGLCGIALKAKTIAEDWKTNPITQLKYCDSYAKARYGSWTAAYEHKLQHKIW